jgi:uncharacterized membrane protein YfcA
MTREDRIVIDTATFAVLFLGALAGGFVSGLAGFGTGLVALGIWLYVLPPSIAVTLVVICSIIAQTWTLPAIWRSIDLKLVWPFLIGGLAGVPLGTMLIAHADPRGFKLSVGVLLLVFPTALYFNRASVALSFGGRVADAAIGFAGGILGALAGLSGPIPTLWASVRGWDKDERRGVFQTTTGPCYRPRCACRQAPASSRGKPFGSRCSRCRQRWSAPGSAREPIAG